MHALMLLLLAGAVPPLAAGEITFEVVFDADTLAGEPAYTGRVYVALAAGARGAEPRVLVHDWFQSAPLFVQDVRGVTAGERVVFTAGDDAVRGHPFELGAIEAGTYRAQAMVRLDPDHPKAGLGTRDLISDVKVVRVVESEGRPVELHLARRAGHEPLRETEFLKRFELESDVLSAFHGRPITLRAGVRLPRGWYDEPERRWPVLYFVMGFGQDHRDAARMFGAGLGPGSEDCLIVFPDPTCFRGHSVFYDSPNNGPWGEAFVRELVPAVEETFLGAGAARQRFVTGASSGGWTALGLLVRYPDEFAACYSHVPDPVDFHDVLGADLYDGDTNFYTRADGTPRPVIRSGGEVLVWMREFVEREGLLGPGGQIGSLEASFSPRGEDGSPLPMFDRATGAVFPDVVDAWRDHDLSNVLRRDWETLGARLEGKLFVWAGEVDNFHLEGSVALLADTLEELGSDAVVEVVPGMAHRLHQPGVRRMMDAVVQSVD